MIQTHPLSHSRMVFAHTLGPAEPEETHQTDYCWWQRVWEATESSGKDDGRVPLLN